MMPATSPHHLPSLYLPHPLCSLSHASHALQVKACSGRGVNVVHRALSLGGQDTPAAVRSGPLLGVTLRKQAAK